MPRAAPLELERWREHRGLGFGFDLWAREYFWEAHEVWESAWQLTAEGATRELLRGLIQLAAARVKDRLDKNDGAARLRSRAAGHLHAAVDHAGRPIVCGVWVDQTIATGELRWRRRTRELPGARTDLLVQPLECLWAVEPDAIVQRTPGYPDYYGGRAVYADRFDPESARAATEAALAIDGPGHVNRIWEVEEPGPPAIETLEGDQLDCFVILVCRRLSRSPARPDGVEVKRLESDRDWARASDFAGRIAMVDFGARGRSFAHWRYTCFRESVELCGGGFFAAFAGDEVVGCLGMIDSGELLRYQDVQVAPAFRRRGIANHLCARAFAETGAGDEKPAVIAAEAGGIPEGIYRRLGFEQVSTQHYLRWKLTAPGT